MTPASRAPSDSFSFPMARPRPEGPAQRPKKIKRLGSGALADRSGQGFPLAIREAGPDRLEFRDGSTSQIGISIVSLVFFCLSAAAALSMVADKTKSLGGRALD